MVLSKVRDRQSIVEAYQSMGIPSSNRKAICESEGDDTDEESLLDLADSIKESNEDVNELYSRLQRIIAVLRQRKAKSTQSQSTISNPQMQNGGMTVAQNSQNPQNQIPTAQPNGQNPKTQSQSSQPTKDGNAQNDGHNHEQKAGNPITGTIGGFVDGVGSLLSAPGSLLKQFGRSISGNTDED